MNSEVWREKFWNSPIFCHVAGQYDHHNNVTRLMVGTATYPAREQVVVAALSECGCRSDSLTAVVAGLGQCAYETRPGGERSAMGR